MSLSETQETMLAMFGAYIADYEEESLAEEEDNPCLTFIPHVKYAQPSTTGRLGICGIACTDASMVAS